MDAILKIGKLSEGDYKKLNMDWEILGFWQMALSLWCFFRD